MSAVPATCVQHLEPCPANVPQEVCEAKLGQSRDRLREYSFEEVQAANAAGNCWLILSGASTCRSAVVLFAEPYTLRMAYVKGRRAVCYSGKVTLLPSRDDLGCDTLAA